MVLPPGLGAGFRGGDRTLNWDIVTLLHMCQSLQLDFKLSVYYQPFEDTNGCFQRSRSITWGALKHLCPGLIQKQLNQNLQGEVRLRHLYFQCLIFKCLMFPRQRHWPRTTVLKFHIYQNHLEELLNHINWVPLTEFVIQLVWGVA